CGVSRPRSGECTRHREARDGNRPRSRRQGTRAAQGSSLERGNDGGTEQRTLCKDRERRADARYARPERSPLGNDAYQTRYRSAEIFRISARAGRRRTGQMNNLVSLETAGAVAIVTFNNPPRGYMNAAQVAQLGEIVDRLTGDDAVRAVIFAGGVPG